MPEPLIRIENLGVAFRDRSSRFGRGSLFWGVRQICFSLEKGDSFCLIGESGSGKSTLALALAGFLPFQEGCMTFKGKKIVKPRDNAHKALIKQIQMVFQDPIQALSPFRTLGQSMEEPLAARGICKKERDVILARLIRDTGLTQDLLDRKPFQASGGQNQRVCIARSLSTRPDLLILDEPLTALDSLTKNRITRLLSQIKKKYPVTSFIITHDMALVKAIATRVGVIYLGRMLETATRQEILSEPAHPYTRALLSASFTPGIWKGERLVLKGDAPSAMNLPRGCIFHPRCPESATICQKQPPPQAKISPGHTVFCHMYTTASEYNKEKVSCPALS
ncbi:ABC transporter ATP-binding protein [Desulfobacter curvatus]|uniref:ABC transporter ATP-binding protein n=1 Tax=Desulfobacter curvatus TaxID=2290 RepID=UPI000379EB4D|nr:ABC transporter ATP-binding protein [Desulfobacter curvatus]